jgi:FKBP-type peptidyl-prolyl cis-trans isomerase
MLKHWIARVGVSVAIASLLAVAGCHKKQDQTASAPSASTSGAPSSSSSQGPSAANNRTPSDEGDLKGGENVEGAPATMSEDAFLAEYKKLAGVTVRPSGLMYRVIQSGPAGGKSPKVSDKVTVAYKGSLMDGTVFDQNQNMTFTISDTISGWQEALPLMKVGDAWEIVVPSAMAYGDKGAKDANGAVVIPPNAPLVFDIKLMDVP